MGPAWHPNRRRGPPPPAEAPNHVPAAQRRQSCWAGRCPVAELLFTKYDLLTSLEQTKKTIATDIDHYDDDQLLAQAESDVMTYLADKYRIDVPALRLDDMY